MTNLMISALCNQSCPYCFTLDHRGLAHKQPPFIDRANFESRLDFLDRSHIDTVRLIGGEPTLHPDFAQLVQCARARGKKIVVFSNGLMPESALTCLASLPIAHCLVLVNVNAPDETKPARHRQRIATIRRLGQRAMLGFNIHRTNCRMDFLLSIIAETGCQSTIRLGMAHPCLSGENCFIHPKQYVAVGRRVTHFAEIAARQGVTLDFDCGFVRCMFSNRDLTRLKALGTQVGWHCSPILDIDIESNVIYCYPLARQWRIPLTTDMDAATLGARFGEWAAPYRRAGVFPECSTCDFKVQGECSGGCLAATMRRFRDVPLTIAVNVAEVR